MLAVWRRGERLIFVPSTFAGVCNTASVRQAVSPAVNQATALKIAPAAMAPSRQRLR